MKRFINFSTIALALILVSTPGVNALEAKKANNKTLASINNSLLVAQAEINGKFVTVEKGHSTTGTVSIIEENGKQYLEFGDDFQTVAGPAVKIILHKNNTVPVNIQEENYISIAPIQSFAGTQRYEVPEEVDLNQYASVAVWCEEFNVTFGYAQL